jgi:hypothetical protein
MEDSPELEMALQIPGDMEMVALAIPDPLLLELDIYCDSLRAHPSCPEEVRNLPMWAFRSNARNAGSRWFAAIVKRRNKNVKESYVVMPLWMWTELICDE